MKNFKPLGLAAAVAAVTVGYTGVTNAQITPPAGPLGIAAETGLGDMAIIPYYTVRGSLSTGLSVINTSDRTQVVKIRLRRAADSMDALDFNVVLSPEDVWTGYVERVAGTAGPITGLEEIRFFTNDNSCTIPENNGSLTMPEIYREGAEEGYIEVIGMGSPIETPVQPISRDALHAQTGPTIGIPRDCTRVSDNFRRGVTPQDYYPDWTSFTGSAPRTRGVVNSALSAQYAVVNGVVTTTAESNAYEDTGNVLKVSYFIKSDETGIEFGNDAEHIENFMDGATITNQTVGVFEGDLQGFDHPDLNGGAPGSAGALASVGTVPNAALRGRYEELRAVLGGATLINDWSDNDQNGSFSVDTDWVVTSPGQYLMTNLFGYLSSLADETVLCGAGDPNLPWQNDPNVANYGANCDFRDIPMLAAAVVYDREERGIIVEEDDLVVSPQPPGIITENVLDQEVNVIRWGTDVLGSSKVIEIPKPAGAFAGYSVLGALPNSGKTQAVCDFVSQTGIDATGLTVDCTAVTNVNPPLIGFVSWQRNFADLPEGNYGRIVRHSRN